MPHGSVSDFHGILGRIDMCLKTHFISLLVQNAPLQVSGLLTCTSHGALSAPSACGAFMVSWALGCVLGLATLMAANVNVLWACRRFKIRPWLVAAMHIFLELLCDIGTRLLWSVS